jgi:predicted nucleic-acid-binding Zn-ribbon protein
MCYHIDNWTLLKTNKIMNSNSLFIFEFKCKNENYELFYIQFTSKIFKTFKKEYIKYANKIHYEEFFIIPNDTLTRLRPDDKIQLKVKPKNNEYIKGLIDDDNKKYELYNSKNT